MFTREFLTGAVLVALSTPVLAQSTLPDDSDPRTVASPPMLVGPAEEPAPPSPASWEYAEDPVKPGTDADFGIGRPASEAEIAVIDIDVMPDGTGLPAGSGDFATGEAIYADKCASCHGDNLEGVKGTGAPMLIGGRGSLASGSPVKTVESYWPHASTLFDYINRAMPLYEPGSLQPDEIYALSAYILGRADVIEKDQVLDAETFRKIVLPNVNGFVEDPRPDRH